MPELPEVETIVRELSLRLPAATISRVQIKHPDIISGTTAAFQRALQGRTIEQVARRAKNIVIRLDDASTLVVSLGMTGRLVAAEARRAGDLTHVAVRFDLEDGRALLYDDVRRFGRLEHFPPDSWERRAERLGVEPLSAAFTAAKLHELTRKSSSPIRNWLLDPYRVAGIGNIYANEALYRSGIRPTRRAHRLSRAETARLRDQIRVVLQESIGMRGTTTSDYVDATGEAGEFWDLRRVYGRAGEPCAQCQTIIKRIVLSNRSAFYCPQCQR